MILQNPEKSQKRFQFLQMQVQTVMNPPLPTVDRFAKDTSNTRPHSRRPVNYLPLKRILRRVRPSQQARALSLPGNGTTVGTAWDVLKKRIVDSVSFALTKSSLVDPGSRSRSAN